MANFEIIRDLALKLCYKLGEIYDKLQVIQERTVKFSGNL